MDPGAFPLTATPLNLVFGVSHSLTGPGTRWPAWPGTRVCSPSASRWSGLHWVSHDYVFIIPVKWRKWLHADQHCSAVMAPPASRLDCNSRNQVEPTWGCRSCCLFPNRITAFGILFHGHMHVSLWLMLMGKPKWWKRCTFQNNKKMTGQKSDPNTPQSHAGSSYLHRKHCTHSLHSLLLLPA